jgi:glycosyltransferase involved in cell wall biosynthesis
VVIPTRDRPALLARCLDAVCKSVRTGDEVIVVDSASRGADTRRLAAEFGTRYIRCDVPGASRARNAGWRAAGNEIVAFIDDDVLATPEWAASVAAACADHPDVDFFTGRTDFVPGEEFTSRSVAIKKDAEPELFVGYARSDLMGHGANLFMRRRALAITGGFDDLLGPGTALPAAEDLDLFDRLLAAGCVGRYEPAACALHVQWRNRRQLLVLDWRYGIGSGARLVKLLGQDRRRAVVATYAFFWGWGFHYVLEYLFARRPFLTTTTLVRVFGGVAGVGRALVARPWRPAHRRP